MPLHSGSVKGRVTRLDGEAVHGAAIVLVETATFRPVAGPLRTDASGRYASDRVAPGTHGILVYGIDGMLVHHWTAATIVVRAGETAVHDIALREAPWLRPGPFYVAGTVVDAVTLVPIQAAYVANVNGFHTETETLLRGTTLPSWGSTDAQGRFLVSCPGGAQGLEPLSISASGYEPTTLVGTGPAFNFFSFGVPLPLLPAPIAPDSVLEVEVRLRPAGSANAAGVVRGLVMHQGEPVVGIRVYLSLNAVTRPDTVPSPAGTPAKPGRASICVPLPNTTAVTDGDGRFELTAVPPGHYNAAAGYEPNDGYEPDYFPLYALATVADGDTAHVRLFPFRSLLPLAPLPGVEVASPDSTVELRWEAMAVRQGYALIGYSVTVIDSLRSRHISVHEPRLVLTGVSPGPVRWFVSASVRDDRAKPTQGGVFERYSSFRLDLEAQSGRRGVTP